MKQMILIFLMVITFYLVYIIFTASCAIKSIHYIQEIRRIR